MSDASGKCVPSLYAATSREAAAFKSVFHDVLPGPFASVSDHELHDRCASILRLRWDLTIVPRHAPDLRRWSLKPGDLSAAPSRHYKKTARWAEAIHRQFDDVDGLVWTSNMSDPERCFIFFGGRVDEGDFDCVTSSSLGVHGQRSSKLDDAPVSRLSPRSIPISPGMAVARLHTDIAVRNLQHIR
ncbi:MAG: RES domain-containing protein [Pelagibaca sp.]